MNRLKDLREDRDLKQSDVANSLGITTMSVSRYEREENALTPDLINKFCDFFEVTSDYLLGRSSTPTARVSKLDTELLQAYHAAPLEIQKIVNAALEAYKPAQVEGKGGVSA